MVAPINITPRSKMTQPIYEDQWMNVQAVSARAPNVKPPPPEQLHSLRNGMVVEVCNHYERFPVELVHKMPSGEWTGKTLLDLTEESKPYSNAGSLIMFDEDNIYDVWI
jgi:hypothetical protein